jgi:hypothetical protein
MTDLISRRHFIKSIGAIAAVSQQAKAEPAVNGKALLHRITRVAIHPTVGLARVGNSSDAFFFGPEVPASTPRGPFKDPNGAVAKQAARFRVYGYDDKGRVVCELTAREANIEWHVNVANCKAAWYSVDTAFDVPGAPSVPRRNAAMSDRSELIIKATPQTLTGAAAGPHPLDGGRFSGIPITLGEILTDSMGRLIVLPGSGSPRFSSS